MATSLAALPALTGRSSAASGGPDGVLAIGSRCCSAIALDQKAGSATEDQIVLFGGRDSNGIQGGTFTWDGSSWADVSISGTPPCPRNSARMAYDPTSEHIILFGGQAGANCNVSQGDFMDETWEYDGEAGTWTQVCITSCDHPSARISQGMATDVDNDNVVLFGGNVDPSATSVVAESNEPDVVDDDTWLYDGTNHEWVEQDPSTVPCALSGSAMSWDGAHGVVVLFGGKGCDPIAAQDDTYTWSGTNWTLCAYDAQHCGTSHPGNRWVTRAAWFPTLGDAGRMVLFGGHDGTVMGGGSDSHLLNETWTINGTWQQCTGGNCTQANSPSVRCCVNMEYDPGLDAIILFGGQHFVSGNKVVLGDTWKFTEDNQWECLLGCS